MNEVILNKVDGFEPKDFVRILENEGEKQMYLEVKYRKIWFNLKYPNGVIRTEIVEKTEQSATVKAMVYMDKKDADSEYIASGYACRRLEESGMQARFLELAETAAKGRALADAGFGIQFHTEMDADEVNQICDAPFPINPGNPPSDESNSSNKKETQKTSAAAIPEKKIPEHPVSEDIQMNESNAVPIPETRQQPAQPLQANGEMSYAEAKSVLCDFGRRNGMTLGEIAMIPDKGFEDISWIANKYNGRNERAKCGAKKILQEAFAK